MYCQCGCGRETKIARYDRPSRGWVKGQPVRFIANHWPRSIRNRARFEKYQKHVSEGERFGLLQVVSVVDQNTQRGGLIALCRCSCGLVVDRYEQWLITGRVGFCGKESRHPEYRSWVHMNGRCYDVNHEAYKNYGGRGISVCKRWKDSFLDFLKDMGPRPDGTSLDRIDPNGNYEPTNCRWADSVLQGRNKRTNKLNEERVALIRSLAGKTRQCEIARMIGVRQQEISRVLTGKRWVGVGLPEVLSAYLGPYMPCV